LRAISLSDGVPDALQVPFRDLREVLRLRGTQHDKGSFVSDGGLPESRHAAFPLALGGERVAELF
jgi:hypothetical protein